MALILALLTAAGFQLRRDDPVAMKVRLGQHARCLEPDVDRAPRCWHQHIRSFDRSSTLNTLLVHVRQSACTI